MTDSKLRSSLIRLAHARPEFRPLLLPVLKMSSAKTVERDRKATHVVIREVNGVREFLNNTLGKGGWSKSWYLAIPYEEPEALAMAQKFGGTAVPRKGTPGSPL